MATRICETSRSRTAGRPRSESVRQGILSAVLDLLKKDSLQTITIEAIARKAGVSKATIYRWWSSKAAVVIDAFIEHHIISTPMRHNMHPITAIVQHWRALAEQYSGWPGRVVAQILAEGQSDPEVLREFRQHFYHNRRALVSEVFELARPTMKLDEDANLDEISAMLYAPLYMKLMWGYPPIGPKFIKSFPITYFKTLGVNLDDDGNVIGDDPVAVGNERIG